MNTRKEEVYRKMMEKTIDGGSGNTNNPPRLKRSRCWAFTLNNPKVGMVAQLIENFKFLNVQYVFQMEEVKTKHLQGAIYFKNPQRTEFQGYFCKEIHWERGRSWRNLKKYCIKLESRIDGPWTNIEGLKWRKSIKDPLKGKTYYSYQKEVMDILKEEPDDRTIYWYWGPKGNDGKSALCKHIKLKYGKNVITVSGKYNDISYAVKARLLEEIDIDIILYDIPRSNIKYVSYLGMEKMKDGYFFNGKYESNECVMNPPHIICFANEEPDRWKMSLDRWKIRRIANQ